MLPAQAEFRTWKDKKGNGIDAELVNTFGGKVVLKDKNGKIYKLDPAKLSEADQLYLNPPPPKYKIYLGKKSNHIPQNNGFDSAQITQAVKYTFSLQVEFLTDDLMPNGLGGTLFIMGEDERGNYVVIDKNDGPITQMESYIGLEGQGCELVSTRNKDGKVVKGVKYKGYLIMLLANDGAVLLKQGSNGFLMDNAEKSLSLVVGDHFNKKLDMQ